MAEEEPQEPPTAEEPQEPPPAEAPPAEPPPAEAPPAEAPPAEETSAPIVAEEPQPPVAAQETEAPVAAATAELKAAEAAAAPSSPRPQSAPVRPEEAAKQRRVSVTSDGPEFDLSGLMSFDPLQQLRVIVPGRARQAPRDEQLARLLFEGHLTQQLFRRLREERPRTRRREGPHHTKSTASELSHASMLGTDGSESAPLPQRAS